MANTPSIYQKAIHKEIQEGTGNLVVNAVAGSGKTTTIVAGLALIPTHYKVTFCAFNNSIVKELKTKVPDFVVTSTMHSLGWEATRRYYESQGKKINLRQYKAFEYCDKVLKPEMIPATNKWGYKQNVVKLIDLIRQSMTFDYEGITELAYKHGLQTSPPQDFYVDLDTYQVENLIPEVYHAVQVLMVMIEDKKNFDFTDMIFVPAINDEIQMRKNDIVFVDECQDLNKAQQMLLQKMMKPTGRFIAVGDPHQAIYGFAGADVESFDTLAAMPDTKSLPLSVCYRCDKNIIAQAQKIVPQIEAFEHKEDGVVRDGEWTEIKDGDWVVCRNVRPLVVLCLELIKSGKKATIKGNDIGAQIATIVKGLKRRTVKAGLKELTTMYLDLIKKYKKLGVKAPLEHPAVLDFKDKMFVIKHIAKTEKYTHVEQIQDKLKQIFTNTVSPITLSTIHKSKGLENERIFFLLPQLIPSKYAVQDWQILQEMNLRYVAITRAEKELVYVKDFDLKDFEPDDEIITPNIETID